MGVQRWELHPAGHMRCRYLQGASLLSGAGAGGWAGLLRLKQAGQEVV